MRGAAVRTPLVQVDLPAGPRTPPDLELYLKLEVLQPIGSFKIRGAYNVVRQLTPDQLPAASGRSAPATRRRASRSPRGEAGARCSVMVMDTAPDTEDRAPSSGSARRSSARRYDECWRTVESHGSDRMTGYFVHPFDDDRFIAGNATAGLEILEDLPDVDAIVAPLGGGGLLAGVAAACAR